MALLHGFGKDGRLLVEELLAQALSSRWSIVCLIAVVLRCVDAFEKEISDGLFIIL